MGRSIRSSSTPISNSVGPISRRPTSPLIKLSLPRSGTLRRSCSLSREPGRSVRVGADFAFYLAEICGARVTGVTPSEEQIARSKARADEKGLAENVKFLCEDFRDVTGVFDRIVSVEMIDNIGRRFYDTFFRKCAELIAEDEIYLLHAVGRREGTDTSSPFIAKYFSPDVYTPVLPELLAAIERAGLLVTDIEILQGAHCAATLMAWRQRFLARREEIERLYDARFFRMWEFWFTGAEISVDTAVVFQIQMTKRHGVVPITRDYIAREEAHLRSVEVSGRLPLQDAGE